MNQYFVALVKHRPLPISCNFYRQVSFRRTWSSSGGMSGNQLSATAMVDTCYSILPCAAFALHCSGFHFVWISTQCDSTVSASANYARLDAVDWPWLDHRVLQDDSSVTFSSTWFVQWVSRFRVIIELLKRWRDDCWGRDFEKRSSRNELNIHISDIGRGRLLFFLLILLLDRQNSEKWT